MQNQLKTNIHLKIKEPKWCDKCGHNLVLLDGKCEFCIKFAKEAEIMAQIKKDALVAKLGGIFAYNNFTEQNFSDKQKLNECVEFPNSNIYIYGDIGTGKTHLATALIRRCEKFYRFKPMQIFRMFRKFDGADKEEENIKELSKNPLLIDDLGSEKGTETKSENLYEIIDRRYELGNSGLIVTSNLNLNIVTKKIGNDRISSRLFQMCKIIKLDGQDFRLNKNREE